MNFLLLLSADCLEIGGFLRISVDFDGSLWIECSILLPPDEIYVKVDRNASWLFVSILTPRVGERS